MLPPWMYKYAVLRRDRGSFAKVAGVMQELCRESPDSREYAKLYKQCRKLV